MKKLSLAILLLAGIAVSASAQSTPPTKWCESDGAPCVTPPTKVIVPSGTISGKTVTITSGGGSGTVTSVAQTFTGGLISVGGSPVTTSGTLALTVAGTSGGIPYFSSGSTWASSGALTANALMIGGGAGAAPSTTTTGTGVLTALGVNVGSAGAFVVNGGALGTPSSGTLTNATGLPIATGVSGLGTGVATALAVNVGSAGAFVTFNGAGGTPSSLTLTNATGLPPTTGISGWPANASGVLTNNGAGVLSWGAAGGGITIGTTTITSGTNTKVLFNNSGVVGEYTITGTGNVAMSASPTFTGTVAAAALTASSTITQTSNSATAFESGPNGGTNPVFRLVNSTASSATGLSITGNAAGSGVTLTALSSGSNEDITVTPKGTGNFTLVGGSSKFIAPANLNTGGLFFAGDTTTGYSWRTSGTLALVNSGGESMRLTSTSVATFNRTVDFNGANGEQIQNAFINEAKTLSTGSTTTTTSTNLAPANSIIDAILVRVNTTITTASNFTVKVTGGNNFVMIGTATSSLTTLTAGTTYVLVPAAYGDQYNATATTLTITTDVNPGAGALRLSVVYRKLTPPTS